MQDFIFTLHFNLVAAPPNTLNLSCILILNRKKGMEKKHFIEIQNEIIDLTKIVQIFFEKMPNGQRFITLSTRIIHFVPIICNDHFYKRFVYNDNQYEIEKFKKDKNNILKAIKIINQLYRISNSEQGNQDETLRIQNQ